MFKPNLPISEWSKHDPSDLLCRGEFRLTYGQGITIRPDERFTTLTMALRGYYSTYSTKRGGIGEGGHESAQNVYLAVVLMSLFLEQYVVAHFDKYDDSVSRTQRGRTVRFSKIIEELETRLKADSPDETVEKLWFFRERIWIVRVFIELRNELAHNGNRIPYVKFLDVLYINHLAPLLVDIIESEDLNYRAIDRPCHCGVQVLRRLCDVHVEDSDLKDYTSTNRLINQLKALGKAVLDSPIMARLQKGEEVYEEVLNEPIRSKLEERVQKYLDEEGITGVFECPCCGSRTLLTMGWKGPTSEGLYVPVLANCHTCRYSIDSIQGEPRSFGLMDKDIFLPIPFEEWTKMRGAKAWIEFCERTKQK